MAASLYELEVTVSSAKDLKNVNWRQGPTRPYAVLWVDPSKKCSTRVDEENDTSPVWDQTLVIPLPPGPIEDAALYIDVVHAGSEEDTKPLIGSARLKLRDILEEAGFCEPLRRSLQLKRPSGRPHGTVRVRVCVRKTRYHAPDPYRAPPYGAPPAAYGNPYGKPHAPPEPPAVGYGAYYGAPLPQAYGNPHVPPQPPAGGYGAYNGGPLPPPHYAYSGELSPAPAPPQHREEEEEESKFEGMWTAVAVGLGVGVGVMAGLALAACFDSSEDENDQDDADEDEDGIVVDADEIVDDGPAEEEGNYED